MDQITPTQIPKAGDSLCGMTLPSDAYDISQRGRIIDLAMRAWPKADSPTETPQFTELVCERLQEKDRGSVLSRSYRVGLACGDTEREFHVTTDFVAIRTMPRAKDQQEWNTARQEIQKHPLATLPLSLPETLEGVRVAWSYPRNTYQIQVSPPEPWDGSDWPESLRADLMAHLTGLGQEAPVLKGERVTVLTVWGAHRWRDASFNLHGDPVQQTVIYIGDHAIYPPYSTVKEHDYAGIYHPERRCGGESETWSDQEASVEQTKREFIQMFAKMHPDTQVDLTQLVMESVSARMFGSSPLGMGPMCTCDDGYRIVLRYKGVPYEFHANEQLAIFHKHGDLTGGAKIIID